MTVVDENGIIHFIGEYEYCVQAMCALKDITNEQETKKKEHQKEV